MKLRHSSGMQPVRRGRRDLQRGSITVEVAVIAPAFVFLMLLVVFAGRISEANGNVTRAASEAARAASLRQHAGDGEHDARATAERNLSAAGMGCTSVDTKVVGSFRPGTTVTVTVSCHALMADVALIGMPGSHTFTARSVEVIDAYRAGKP